MVYNSFGVSNDCAWSIFQILNKNYILMQPCFEEFRLVRVWKVACELPKVCFAVLDSQYMYSLQWSLPSYNYLQTPQVVLGSSLIVLRCLQCLSPRVCMLRLGLTFTVWDWHQFKRADHRRQGGHFRWNEGSDQSSDRGTSCCGSPCNKTTTGWRRRCSLSCIPGLVRHSCRKETRITLKARRPCRDTSGPICGTPCQRSGKAKGRSVSVCSRSILQADH